MTWWWRCRPASPSTSRSSWPSSWSRPWARSGLRCEAAAGGVGHSRRRFSATSRVVLLLPQGEDLDDNRAYFDRLVAYAQPHGHHAGIWRQHRRPRSALHRRRHRALSVLQHLPGGRPGVLPARARRLRQPGHRSGVGAACRWRCSSTPCSSATCASTCPTTSRSATPPSSSGVDDFGGLHQLRDDVLGACCRRGRRGAHRPRHGSSAGLRRTRRSLRAFCGIDVVADQYLALYAQLGAATAR